MEFFINVAFFAAAQGVFLSLVLFFLKRGNIKANFFLAFLILCFSLWLAEFAAYFTNYFSDFPHLLFSTVGLPLLFGPLLWFYALALKGRKSLFVKWDWLHLLPFLAYTLYYMPIYLETTEFKIGIIQQIRNVLDPPKFSISFFLNETAKFLHLVLYLFFVNRMCSRWKKENNTTNLEALHQKWIKQLLIGLVLFAIFDISHLLSIFFFKYANLFIIARGVLISCTLVVYYIGYSTFRQPEIIAGTLEKQKATSRYEKSSLSQEKAEHYLQQLLQKMEKDQYYLDPDLNLKKLAAELDLSTHHLSQLLNKYLQKSFFDFVNEYRVKAAQKMLADPDRAQFTILSIAYDAGFKTKASFNTAFKKFTQLTPSQYRKGSLGKTKAKKE